MWSLRSSKTKKNTTKKSEAKKNTRKNMCNNNNNNAAKRGGCVVTIKNQKKNIVVTFKQPKKRQSEDYLQKYEDQLVFSIIDHVDGFFFEKDLYKREGNQEIINCLLGKTNKVLCGGSKKESLTLGDTSVHNMTGLLKQHLKSLPECFLSQRLYKKFLDVNSVKDEDEKVNLILDLMLEWTPAETNLFMQVMDHLDNVYRHRKYNNMSSQELAMCFTPILLSGKKYDNSDPKQAQVSLTETKAATQVIQFIIEKWADICLDDDYYSDTEVLTEAELKIENEKLKRCLERNQNCFMQQKEQQKQQQKQKQKQQQKQQQKQKQKQKQRRIDTDIDTDIDTETETETEIEVEIETKNKKMKTSTAMSICNPYAP